MSLPTGATLLAGVHFRGRAMSFPFVGVFAQSRWLSAEETALAHRTLISEFAEFGPRATWWWRPMHVAACAGAECAKAGGVFGCFDGAQVVAIVAVKPDARYAAPAWLVWDTVLARDHCGQGLAPRVQRAVLDRLDPSQAPLVAGTIAAANLPSLRTALRVGRQIMGSWAFIADGPKPT